MKLKFKIVVLLLPTTTSSREDTSHSHLQLEKEKEKKSVYLSYILCISLFFYEKPLLLFVLILVRAYQVF